MDFGHILLLDYSSSILSSLYISLSLALLFYLLQENISVHLMDFRPFLKNSEPPDIYLDLDVIQSVCNERDFLYASLIPTICHCHSAGCPWFCLPFDETFHENNMRCINVHFKKLI